MKLTVKDLNKILGYLEVAKATTERALKESNPTSKYAECMERQLDGINTIIQRIENMEV